MTEDRMKNVIWYADIKMILLKAGIPNEIVNDVGEDIYQATKANWKN